MKNIVAEPPHPIAMVGQRMERSDVQKDHDGSNRAQGRDRIHERKQARGWTRALLHCGVALAVAALAFPASGKINGIAGYAGAPGDPSQGQTQFCAPCHSGGSFGGELTIAIEEPEDIAPSDVVPVDLYFTADGAAPSRWGFNLIAIDDATGEPVGQLIVGVGTDSKLLTSSAGWEYLSHTIAGTTSEFNGGPGWALDWQAPPEAVESVRFYASFNAANGNIGKSGDSLITQQVIVSVPEPGALGAGVIALLALAAVRPRRH